MPKLYSSLSIVALLLLLPSCATVMSSGVHHVPIDSVPQGAVVSYEGANVGVTPCTVAMRSRCNRLVLAHDGYHEQVVEVGRGTNGWVLGNLLFGGVVGMAIDGASGRGGRISTKPCWVELTPLGDPRPGLWTQPPDPRHQFIADDTKGWIPEGQTEAPEVTAARKPTRAPKWEDRPAVIAQPKRWDPDF